MNAICVADYEKYSRHHDEDLPSFKIAATRSFPSRLTCSLSILWKSSNLIEFISTTVTHIVQKNICFLNHEFCCIQKRGGGSKGFIIEMCLMTTNWEHVLQWSNLVFHKIIKKKPHQMAPNECGILRVTVFHSSFELPCKHLSEVTTRKLSFDGSLFCIINFAFCVLFLTDWSSVKTFSVFQVSTT